MKMVNVVLGIATTLVLGALIVLGIKAFYAEPVSPTYPNIAVVAPCASGDTVCQQQDTALTNQQEATFNQEQQAYEDQMMVYDKNLFIIANLIGIIVFAIGFWFIFGAKLSSQGAPIGIMLAGLWSIIYGYGRGWGSVDNQLKFFIGLVIAVVMIGGSMWLIERYKHHHAR